jgi:hypothetical protein
VQLTVLDQLLWAATFGEDLILVFVLLYRRRMRRFPVFTALISLDIVRTIALFAIDHFGAKAVYFYTYWSFALVDVALQLGVLYRVTSHVFQPTGSWAKGTIKGLIALVAASLTIATFLTWIPKPPAVVPLQVFLLKGNFFSALLLCELSVGIFALSVRAGLSWTTHVARIMQGFIAYLFCTLALETARTYFGVSRGSRAYDDLSHVRICVYLLCMGYWIVTLWRNAPAPRRLTSVMHQQVSAIRQVVAGRIEARRAEAKP